ncbi:amino acid ABC transporter permease [Aestuariivirga sp. YIM B02566]|uniref:Amino acid ABC transporter permease n=1 Tax=Taklimakanibacter albus TaxID=2800327 RepID=A0ACC5QXE2_9HYPH|nr:amino acid ABC transporter permease [Aestuariivirga sp. YIM B02566]MBK1865035.1 amino acid ABC transporter permease [Aestuariivirga sp. YIM B02566]
MTAVIDEARPQRVSAFNDPKIRSRVAQIIFLLLVLWLGYEIIHNTAVNLARLNKTFDYKFQFLWTTAGFDIIQRPIEYTRDSTYFRAILVGFLNTLIVAALGIFFATVIGFIIGIMRLSSNWVIAKIATGYVELIRNIPLLLQIFFWYAAVLKPLPGPKESVNFFDLAFLSNRGLVTLKFIWGEGSGYIVIAFILGVVGALAVGHWAKRRQERTGEQFHSFWAGLGLIIGLPLLAFLILGGPVTFEYPVFKGFNFVGGFTILPELIALVLALSIYTASFIAEIVRAGIMAVSHGQTEAAHSLGLRSQPTLRLVVIPQALRVIIPPLTSQYLNLTKNSSLAVAIAYPDLVAMGGVVNNQSGRAVEVVLIWMFIYLSLSLVTSAFMNWYNARVRLVER